ncbi:MAG: glycosyltransferase family A protein [Paludibaculum sp.]
MHIQPLVSAVIPTYNRERTIGSAVDSILGQSYPNVEVIVVDDGSTDGTEQRLQQYGEKIRVIRQKNAGPAAARNRGIAAARGKYVAFLDSDDIWMPDKLERQVQLMEAAGEAVPCCVCNINMCWSDKQLASFDIAALKPSIAEGLWLNAPEVLVTRFLLFNQGVMIRKDALDSLGGFDERLWLLEDHELALRLSLAGPWAFIRDPLAQWRESKSSLYKSACKDEMRPAEALVQVLERHASRVETNTERPGLRNYVKHELSSAKRQLRIARMAQSRSWAASAATALFRKAEQYRRSFYIRSAAFPKMKFVALPSDNCEREA